MQAIHPSKEMMNLLVMNFLEVEGYKQGVQNFAKETGLKGINIYI
jgi:hypothetical protein